MKNLNNLLSWPNILTYIRIVLLPFLIIIFYLPYQWAHYATTALFLFASFTDWLDGYLARTLGQFSRFGAFLDPVADKLLVVVSLVLLVGDQTVPYITVPALVVIGREVVISALREWMAEMGKRASITVNYIAKIKTCVQMSSIALLLLHAAPHYFILTILGYIGFYVASILTLWSMCLYLKIAWPSLSMPD